MVDRNWIIAFAFGVRSSCPHLNPSLKGVLEMKLVLVMGQALGSVAEHAVELKMEWQGRLLKGEAG